MSDHENSSLRVEIGMFVLNNELAKKLKEKLEAHLARDFSNVSVVVDTTPERRIIGFVGQDNHSVAVTHANEIIDKIICEGETSVSINWDYMA